MSIYTIKKNQLLTKIIAFAAVPGAWFRLRAMQLEGSHLSMGIRQSRAMRSVRHVLPQSVRKAAVRRAEIRL